MHSFRRSDNHSMQCRSVYLAPTQKIQRSGLRYPWMGFARSAYLSFCTKRAPSDTRELARTPIQNMVRTRNSLFYHILMAASHEIAALAAQVVSATKGRVAVCDHHQLGKQAKLAILKFRLTVWQTSKPCWMLGAWPR